MLKKRKFMTILAALNGYLNDKLSTAILSAVGIDKSAKPESLTEKQLEIIVRQVKNYRLEVQSRRGFDFAQVTQGGVDTSEIDCHTMESKLVKNLYFAGELIDVDGICGGYNLQFAWATGVIAGGNCHK